MRFLVLIGFGICFFSSLQRVKEITNTHYQDCFYQCGCNVSDLGSSSTQTKHREGLHVASVAKELGLLHWNVESGGADPTVIAEQLVALIKGDRYQIVALSEVAQPDVFLNRLNSATDGQWKMVVGKSGRQGRNPKSHDRLVLLYQSRRLSLEKSFELKQYGEYQLDTGRHRCPLVALFKVQDNGQVIMLLHNHLARGNAEFRTKQATALREFARNEALPKIAVGDYNFDYDFLSQKGNQGMTEMLRDGIWEWVKPSELIDTNWYDPDADGVDNYPDSMLDFTFVSGSAKDWVTRSRVIVREGDFPDDDSTSDHRPVEVLIKF